MAGEDHPNGKRGDNGPILRAFSNDHSLRTPFFLGLILFFVVLATLLSFAPRWHFVSRGEAREALVIAAMDQQKNLILPLRNGVDIPSKPPLFHWCALGFEKLLHQPELSFRLPSVCAAAVLVFLLYCFACPVLGPTSAAFASLLLLSSLDFFRTAMVARVDMLFALWVVAAILALGEVVEDFVLLRRRNMRALVLASCAIVLGVLTKGPAALVFPWLIAGITLLCFVPLKEIPWKLAFAAGSTTAFVSCLWYLAAYGIGGRAFLETQVMRENVARVVGMDEYHTGHAGAFYMPFLLLLLGLLPLSLMLPQLFVALNKKRMLLKKPRIAYVAIWALFFPVFFSFTASQRSVYLLQCIPAWVFLFVLGARELETFQTDAPRVARVMRILLQVVAGAIVALTALTVLIALIPWFLTLLRLREPELLVARAIFKSLLQSFSAALLLGGAALMAYRAFRAAQSASLHESLGCLAISFLVIQMGILRSALPAIAEVTSPAAFMREATRYAREHGGRLYQYDDDFYAANYYAYQNVPRLNAGAPPSNEFAIYLLLRLDQLEQGKKQFPGLSVVLTSDRFDVYGKDRFALAEIPQVR